MGSTVISDTEIFDNFLQEGFEFTKLQKVCIQEKKKKINPKRPQTNPVKRKMQNWDKSEYAKTKNPAYGRQSISRPMRIVAPMPQ